MKELILKIFDKREQS